MFSSMSDSTPSTPTTSTSVSMTKTNKHKSKSSSKSKTSHPSSSHKHKIRHNQSSSATGYEPVGNPKKTVHSDEEQKKPIDFPTTEESETSSVGSGDESESTSSLQEEAEIDEEEESTDSPNLKPTPKGNIESLLIQTLQSSLNRPTSKNGLYGDTSVSMNLPKMPFLTGPTAVEYSNWVTKAINYFQTYGLEEVVTMSPRDSLTRAFAFDPQSSVGNIKGIWSRLHTRAVGLIKTAVESVIGTDLFDGIEDEQAIVGECNMYGGDTEDKTRLPWLDSFIAKNANLVWVRIKDRQQRYTAHDKANLVRRLLELKYPVGTDPTSCRRKFAALVKHLRNAGITLHDDILMSVWFSALPKELSVLKQALGAKEQLKWTDIYNSLIQDYSSRVDL
ncbi:MAG TPA: hypothetical protein VHA52_08400, partial [Candidatus Babeliaceae bacterium]|nr:hypothetical protein [Candidatus Babeliaceae bacterium]